MAATVFVSETNGTTGSPTTTDNIANMNFGSADVPNIVPASHPINVASSSVAKWWRIKLQALNGSTQIKNFKVWKASGAFVTGETMGGIVADTGFNTYPAGYGLAWVRFGSGAVGVPYSGNGAAVMGGHTWGDVSFPLPTSLPASNCIPIGGSFAAALNADGTYSDYLAMGMNTTVSTPVGPVNTKTFTWQYDES